MPLKMAHRLSLNVLKMVKKISKKFLPATAAINAKMLKSFIFFSLSLVEIYDVKMVKNVNPFK